LDDTELRVQLKPAASNEKTYGSQTSEARYGPKVISLRGRWRSYALPADAEADARLGADVDRYSFTAVDSHHLLFASFAGALIISCISL
jgi:hypothetical protein